MGPPHQCFIGRSFHFEWKNLICALRVVKICYLRLFRILTDGGTLLWQKYLERKAPGWKCSWTLWRWVAREQMELRISLQNEEPMIYKTLEGSWHLSTNHRKDIPSKSIVFLKVPIFVWRKLAYRPLPCQHKFTSNYIGFLALCDNPCTWSNSDHFYRWPHRYCRPSPLRPEPSAKPWWAVCGCLGT